MLAERMHREQVISLAAKIQALSNLPTTYRTGPAYTHMGALLADAVLQAGLNYRTVVWPRVNRILALWSEATSTSDLLRLIHSCGASHILQWTHQEKLNRFVLLGEFVRNNAIETVPEFASWLGDESNVFEILTVRGVGPKTVDYLKNLTGMPVVAVDRHIRAFVESVGITCGSYAQVRLLVEDAAAFLRLSPSLVDHAIWLHRSTPQLRTKQNE
jgi:hypothetical protein